MAISIQLLALLLPSLLYPLLGMLPSGLLLQIGIPELEALYGAINFLPAFCEFIQYHAPHAFTPSKYD
jgi:hypothetical protein